ncbi:MAG: 2-succinyl-5-enolpyruvyl-6-hydroxy-3-cyclohexene-1-carboxylic-acid synthase [Mycobacteriales bacterium]
MNPSTACALVIVDELARCGIREAVLAPGSRSAPLALALHDADADGRIRLHVRIDERSAGFLAIGLARGSGSPVPVVCTSGTAVANLHPAVLEAAHDGVPLIPLTADRPSEARGTDANQMIDQRGIFGPDVWSLDLAGPTSGPDQVHYWRSSIRAACAVALPAGRRPAPAHVNVPFREPLLPDGDESFAEPLDRDAADLLRPADPPAEPPIRLGARPLLIAAVGTTLPDWARSGTVPVVSETAGAGHPDTVLTAGNWLLADPAFMAGHRPDQVICIGRNTLFRGVRALVTDPQIRLDLVADAGTPAPDRELTRHRPGGTASGAPNAAWTRSWRAADAAAVSALLAELDRVPDGLRLAHDLVAAVPAGAILVAGSSQPIRDLGLAAPTRPDVSVIANRGVAGIDGIVSTAVGVALAAARLDPARPTLALLGDLTFVHDHNGLILGPDEPRPDLTLVVANNDGGAIFSLLEQGGAPFAPSFERVFGTPHNTDLRHLCAATGTAYDDRDGPLGTVPSRSGISVIDVRIDRADIRARYQRVARAIRLSLA